jgi:putative transposase
MAKIDREHELPLTRQCELLDVNRSSVYYERAPLSEGDAGLLFEIDKIHTDRPFLGSRRIVDELEDVGLNVNRKAVQRLMRLAGIEAIYQRPKTSRMGSGASHRVFPYLLADVPIERPNQVWATDITFIPMPAGFAYLVAILDVFSRRALAWRLSNTMEARFCVEALQEAIAIHGVPEVFNTDQGSQFTSREFTSVLEENGVAISMDGRGRWLDNVFVERFWRSLKYENVYLHAYSDLAAARAGIGAYIAYYNGRRRHTSLGRRTPDAVYAGVDRGEIPITRHVRNSGVLTTGTAA